MKKLITIIVFLLLIGLVNALDLMTIFQSKELIWTQNYKSGDSFPICDLDFKAEPLKYTCSAPERGYINLPNPERTCWRSEVYFEGDFTFFPDDEKQLNEYLKVKYYPSGRIYTGYIGIGEEKKWYEGVFKDKTDWTNNWKFDFIKKDFLLAEHISTRTLFTLGEEGEIKFRINNDFANCDGGFFAGYEKTLEYIPSENIDRKISKGTQALTYKPDTTQLGLHKITIYPYIYVSDVKFLDDRGLDIYYNVVPNIDIYKDTSTKCNFDLDCPEGFGCVIYKYDNRDVGICEKNVFKDEVSGKIIIKKEKTFLERYWFFFAIPVVILIIIFYKKK